MLDLCAVDQRAERVHAQRALILRAEPVADEIGNDPRRVRRQHVDAEGRLVELAVVAVGEDVEAVGQTAVERIDAGSRIDLAEPPVRDRWRIGKGPGRCVEVRAREGRQRARVETKAFAGIVADARRSGDPCKTVGFQVRETRLDRRDAVAVAGEAIALLQGARRRIGPRPLRTRYGAVRGHGAVAAAFDGGIDTRRPAALARDDVDDATDRIRSIERALRPAQHLDALDRRRRKHREVEIAAGVCGIVGANAVDQHQRLPGIAAAQADRRRRARPARLADVEARNGAQRIDQRGGIGRGDRRAIDDADRAARCGRERPALGRL